MYLQVNGTYFKVMKHLLLTTIAAVVLVGCGESQQSEPTTAKALDILIHNAADEGDIEAIKQCLAAGADVNCKDTHGGTLLHRSVGNYGILARKEIFELLIANGADVNAKDGVGETPLHWAAKEGNKEVVELLIAKGADVNAKDDVGDTPVDWADNKEISDLLRKHGAKTGEELKAEGK